MGELGELDEDGEVVLEKEDPRAAFKREMLAAGHSHAGASAIEE
jgi:hypothetical protein